MTIAQPRADGRGAVLAGYLASDALSLMGNAVALVVLPLLVLQRTGSAGATAVVMAASTVPAIAAGLAGGAVVDRFDRRRVSVAADLVSAGSVAALPVVDALLGLGIGWFVLLGVVGAFGDLPGMAAREALAPRVAARSGTTLERLAAIREGLGALVMIAGPAAAGTLVWLVPATTALWVTAATSAAAAGLTWLLPRDVGAFDRAGRPPASASAAVADSAPPPRPAAR